MTDATAAHTITITRTFEADRELVFDAWTDPAQVAAWFGPADCVTPQESITIELEVGGRYEFAMVPLGGGRAQEVRYEVVEFSRPELLVMRCGPMPEIGLHNDTVVRVELHEDPAGTRMVLTDGPYPQEGGGGADAGWASSFDKLAALLAR